MAGMKDNQDTDTQSSRLMALPAEVRNLIWHFMVTDPCPVLWPRQPAITAANRQIRSECLAMYYAANNFQFVLQTPEDYEATLRSLNVNRHHLKHLQRTSVVFHISLGLSCTSMMSIDVDVPTSPGRDESNLVMELKLGPCKWERAEGKVQCTRWIGEHVGSSMFGWAGDLGDWKKLVYALRTVVFILSRSRDS